jgi:hypothetical protein
MKEATNLPQNYREGDMMSEISEETLMRDGIPIEKGVSLTREFLDINQDLFTKYLNLWILYPDLFLDVI